jgi:hypothetical protein
LAAISEAYSAVAASLDRPAPAWDRSLGLFLLPWPIVLTLSALLLFRGHRPKLGFFLILASPFTYEAFLVAEAFGRTSPPAGRGDWLFLFMWTAFLSVTIGLTSLVLRDSNSANHVAGTTR